MNTRVRRVDVLGHQVRVSVRPGTEAGPPLVICNGIGASLDLLEPFVDALDRRIEVVTFDVPGAGGSPAPSCPTTSPCSHASSSVARPAGRRVRRPRHLLGRRSRPTGGIPASAALPPTGAGHPRPDRSHGPGQPAGAAHDGHPPPVPRPRLRHVDCTAGGAGSEPEPERARTLLRQHSRVGTRCGYLFQLLAGVGWTSLPLLPFIRQPTLILAGADDPIIPLVNARIMARLLPDATLHVYDDGHLGLITQAHELAPVVTDFLLN